MLKKDDTCPICNMAFLEDKYPLVVRLPCHPRHWFDLECIAPWLKLQQVCETGGREVCWGVVMRANGESRLVRWIESVW